MAELAVKFIDYSSSSKTSEVSDDAGLVSSLEGRLCVPYLTVKGGGGS